MKSLRLLLLSILVVFSTFASAEVIHVWADAHKFGPNAISFHPVKGQYFVGDNHDMANCPNKKLEDCRLEYRDFLAEFWDYQVEGNHERIGINREFLTIRPGVGLYHFDLQSDRKRWTKYRYKEQGAGWLKRKIIAPGIDFIGDRLERGLKKEFLEQAVKDAKKNGHHTMIGGHFHPSKKIDVIYKGIRIVVLPPGLSAVEI